MSWNTPYGTKVRRQTNRALMVLHPPVEIPGELLPAFDAARGGERRGIGHDRGGRAKGVTVVTARAIFDAAGYQWQQYDGEDMLFNDAYGPFVVPAVERRADNAGNAADKDILAGRVGTAEEQSVARAAVEARLAKLAQIGSRSAAREITRLERLLLA